MKNTYIYLLLIALIGTGCSDWLDVSPRTQMDENKQFKSEVGFKSAHTGSYMLMTDSRLYGKDANMFLPEALARSWQIPAGSSSSVERITLTELSNMRYAGDKNAEAVIEGVWTQYYNVIVQLNNVLENLEKSDLTFTFKNDQLIRGEILGLRAFLHLEVLRFFGSVPGEGNEGVPYVLKMTNSIDALTSKPYSEVVSLIKKDLDEAEELLGSMDMILDYSKEELDSQVLLENTGIGRYDEWQTQRQGRFNYYAVLGTKSRYYNWIGEKDEAVKYAKMVIDAKNKDNTPKFPLVSKTTFKDHILYTENIFTLHYPKLVTKLSSLFEPKDALFNQTRVNIEKANAFGAPGVNDFRTIKDRYFKEVIHETTTVNHFYKFVGNEIHPSLNKVPLLKLSELYLTVAEYADLSVSKEYFATYAISRGLVSDEVENGMSEEAKKKTIIEREWRREFFGEGQMFFFYKKRNYAAYTWPTAFVVPVGAYVVPKPKGQINFE